MKYIKTYEAKMTQKVLLESISNFLTKSLPDNFTVKVYNGTINVKDINSKKTSGYIYVLGDVDTGFQLHLNSRTIEGSDFYIAVDYIIQKFKDYKIPMTYDYNEHPDWRYDKAYIVTFGEDVFYRIINVFEYLPTEDLSIVMKSNKYNL